MFITFEGIEGSGKTTQIERARTFLEGQGLSVVLTREPGGTAIGKKIRAILLDPASDRLDPTAELLLYFADRAQHLQEKVRPHLAKGATVLCDRYYDATLAYQGHARGLSMPLIEHLHQLVLDDFKPDLTFLLDLPPQVGLARAWRQIESGARTGNETRFETEALKFHESVRQGYLALASREPLRFRKIDASQKADDVWNQIRSVLSTVKQA